MAEVIEPAPEAAAGEFAGYPHFDAGELAKNADVLFALADVEDNSLALFKAIKLILGKERIGELRACVVRDCGTFDANRVMLWFNYEQTRNAELKN